METTYKQILDEARRLAQNKKRLRFPPRILLLVALLSIALMFAGVWINIYLVFSIAAGMLVADLIVFALVGGLTIVLGKVSENDIQLMIPKAIEAREIELREEMEDAQEWITAVAEEKKQAIGRLEETRGAYAQFRTIKRQFESTLN